jgi:hypothetical protein
MENTPNLQMTPPQPSDEKKPNVLWLAIGVIAVVVIVVVWMLSRPAYAPEPSDVVPDDTVAGVVVDEDVAEVIPDAAEELQALEEQGTSDNLADIEADLNASGLDTLDQELLDIEQELQGL